MLTSRVNVATTLSEFSSSSGFISIQSGRWTFLYSHPTTAVSYFRSQPNRNAAIKIPARWSPGHRNKNLRMARLQVFAIERRPLRVAQGTATNIRKTITITRFRPEPFVTGIISDIRVKIHTTRQQYPTAEAKFNTCRLLTSVLRGSKINL